MSPNPSEPRPKLSPRRRRLRLTVGWLALAAVIGLVAGGFVYRHNHPTTYSPAELNPDITSQLSRNLPQDAPKPDLEDVTESAGLNRYRAFRGPRTSQLPEDMGPGAAWGDFNNDGFEDLFVVSAGGSLALSLDELEPCVLYRNRGDGSFESTPEFPTTRIRGLSAAWADYDADGFLDLVVSGYDALLLFHNEAGSGRFTIDPNFTHRPGFWAGVSWGDFDNDRDLDLYVCGYVHYTGTAADRDRTSEQLGTAVPYTLNPATFAPAPNLLFQNNGDGTFSEVAEPLGVDNPKGRSLGALWHDFDQDGWLDLYVANDVSDNVFYHNDQGQFRDISHPAYVADYRSAMGLAVGDYNRDGDDDLYVTHWVAQENALYDNLLADTQARPANPQNRPLAPLYFMDLADARGLGQIALPSVGWGSEFVDLDADGWLDLVVVNGSTLETTEQPPQLKPQKPFLFWNQQGRHFHNIAPLAPALRQAHVGRGLAVADYDNDGDMDLLFVHLDHSLQLLQNRLHQGRWLKVQLRSLNSRGETAGFAEGATAIAHLGTNRLRRSVTGVSYLSQSSRVLHFGLGTATTVDRLEVRWLGGLTNFFTNLHANTTFLITEKPPSAAPIPHLSSPANLSARTPSPVESSANERSEQRLFWAAQRQAMDALKRDQDYPRAAELFERALGFNPAHEDSLYYLSHCLAAQGRIDQSVLTLEKLIRQNRNSHRGYLQLATLQVTHAQGREDLERALVNLQQARAINPEETRALLLLGEVALLRDELEQAAQHFEHVSRTNPRSVPALFFRGYLAWRTGEVDAATQLLTETRTALGQDWQPAGTTSEGDTRHQWHSDATPLSRFWRSWTGSSDPAPAFSALHHTVTQAP